MAIITSNKHQLLKSAISKVTSVWSEYFSRNANNLSTGAEDECTPKMSLASLDKFDNFFDSLAKIYSLAILSFIVILKCHNNQYQREISVL